MLVLAVVVTASPVAADSIRTLDTAGIVGNYSSVALDEQGHPVIAYYDGTNGNLKLIRCTNPSCSGQQTPQTVETVGNSGFTLSLALDSDGHPVIAHRDSANDDLRLVRCDTLDCSGAQTGVAVDSDGDVGSTPSLVLDADDNPVIAYRDNDAETIQLVHCTNRSCTGSQQPRPITTAGVAYTPWVELDASGNPVVAFARGGIQLVHCTNPNCTGPQQTETVESENSHSPTMALDEDGNPVVAYVRGAELRLVACTTSDCSGAQTAQPVVTGSGVTSFYTPEIALEGGRLPAITYTEGNQRDLAVLRCLQPDCSDTPQPQFPDTVGEVGDHPSIALTPAGHPVISYQDSTNDDLKVLVCTSRFCNGTEPPVIDVAAAAEVEQDDSVELSATATDPDGGPVELFWDLDGDEVTDVMGQTATFDADGLQPGQYSVTVTAVDDEGQVTTATVTVTVTPIAVLSGTAAVADGQVEITITNTGLMAGTAGPVEVRLDGAGTATGDGCVAVTGGVDCQPGVVEAAGTLTTTVALTATGLTPLQVQVDGADFDSPATGTIPPPPIGEPIEAAVQISNERFPTGGASIVVLSRNDVFADSLTGAVLTGDGPLLYTPTGTLDPRTRDEIDRLLAGSGTVFLLGGETAISPAVSQSLQAAGYTPIRLAGPSRVETAVAIADQAASLFGQPQMAVVARADAPADNPTAAWADAVASGGWAAATGQPILLTQTASAHPATAAWLQGHPSTDVVVVGGAAAVSQAAADGLGADSRVEGPNRFATAAAVSAELWPAVPAGHILAPGGSDDGWAYTLAAAGLSADLNWPLLLIELDRLQAETAAATCPGGDRLPTLVVSPTATTSADVATDLAQPC
ncbi:cell wall-binding repeat-containing protein [Euzebya tangerina]|uniref:cell wall-binding repeat-containing protein n=1 Tax=Euzebya tangerina TaxID=591198 RepID=UPI0013C324C4|nr:cell wall-binding repeat-containing protein [Euzebya tangerina]